MTTVPADVEGPGDAELIAAVRRGTLSAYGVLYERHVAAAHNLARQLSRSPAEADDLVSEAFAKVLDTLRAGRGPDSAFRAYLLTALRHAAYDKTRRERKLELAHDVSTVSGISVAAVSQEFDDTAVKGLERSLAAQAFARLPERWQAVLWHTEIEGQSPAEVAPILGLTANGVSALAYRAREGLRQAYLQVHLAETSDRNCRAAAERLGAWTRSGLAKREKAQVEAHLDTCARCRALAAELANVNGAMRSFVAPLVLGIGTSGYLAATGIVKVATLTSAAGAAGVAGAVAAGPQHFLGLAASSLTLTAALVVGLAVGDDPPENPSAGAAPTLTAPALETSELSGQQRPSPRPLPRQPPASAPTAPPAEAPSSGSPRLDASGPDTAVTLVEGGDPADVPLTVRNTGDTRSGPVTTVLTLPAGVNAVPVDVFSAPPPILDGDHDAGTVGCPGGVGTVTCAGTEGLAPGESVTLLFRLRAEAGSVGGTVTGLVSAGSVALADVAVQVDVVPPGPSDDVLLTVRVTADLRGLLGLWVNPVIEVAVTNTGTSSLPVSITVDQRTRVNWSSQALDCEQGGGHTCVTPAALAPGERLEAKLEILAELVPEPDREQLHVSAALGDATGRMGITLWDWLFLPGPAPGTPLETPGAPVASEEPVPRTPTTVRPTTNTTPPTAPVLPSSGAPPTMPVSVPSTTTTPAPTQDRSEPAPEQEPVPAGGGLGGLLGWLLGG